MRRLSVSRSNLAAAENNGIDLLNIYPLNVALSVKAFKRLGVNIFYFSTYFLTLNVPSHNLLSSANPFNFPSKFPDIIKFVTN